MTGLVTHGPKGEAVGVEGDVGQGHPEIPVEGGGVGYANPVKAERLGGLHPLHQLVARAGLEVAANFYVHFFVHLEKLVGVIAHYRWAASVGIEGERWEAAHVIPSPLRNLAGPRLTFSTTTRFFDSAPLRSE